MIRVGDSVVWITGATGGIGREVALICAAGGASLVLSSRSVPRLETLERACLAAGAAKTKLLAFDVRDAAEIGKAALAIERDLGRIDGFVASAADVPVGTLESLSPDDWAYGIQNKLLATVSCLKAVLPMMRERKQGRVVVLSGVRGTEPIGQSLLPGAVNAALNNVVKGLSRDFARHNVAINAVSPALVMTQRGENVISAESKATGKPVEEIRAEMTRNLPAGRFVTAPEVARVIYELLFSLPASLTGQTIIVDASESRGSR